MSGWRLPPSQQGDGSLFWGIFWFIVIFFIAFGGLNQVLNDLGILDYFERDLEVLFLLIIFGLAVIISGILTLLLILYFYYWIPSNRDIKLPEPASKLKKNLHRKRYHLIIFLLVIVNLVMVGSSIKYGYGIKGFLLTLITMTIISVTTYLLLKYLKTGTLLTILLSATLFLNLDLQDTVLYCTKHTEYEDPSKTLLILFKMRMNPCDISMYYFYK